MKRLLKTRTMSSFFLAVALFLSLALSASAAGGTEIISPIGSYTSAPTTITWSQQSNAKAAQIFIGSTDNTFSYNSGAIYSNAGASTAYYQIPLDIVASMPKGKTYRIYLETYHYNGNNYVGYNTDQEFYSFN
ncbi:hypothetical protein [Paenibacillus sp. FJAT-26967]|uniref:hypothetical protein n=1 Tax=Paenibacillus sp. FJAT-26967 TaxID=1729690 RepID=UPI0008380D06|nr:hypothetical protein [Paenibacillus sp. FJAT-26967]